MAHPDEIIHTRLFPTIVYAPSSLARFETATKILEGDRAIISTDVDASGDMGKQLDRLKKARLDVEAVEEKIGQDVGRQSRKAGHSATAATLGAGGVLGLAFGIAALATGNAQWLGASVISAASSVPLAVRMRDIWAVRKAGKLADLYAPVRDRLAAVRQNAQLKIDRIMSPDNTAKLALSPSATELSTQYPDVRAHFANAYINLTRQQPPANIPPPARPAPRQGSRKNSTGTTLKRVLPVAHGCTKDDKCCKAARRKKPPVGGPGGT